VGSFAILYFQRHGSVRFSVRSGSFFMHANVFNNFSASFSGSFRFVFGLQSFIFNHFSGSFFKKAFFCPTCLKISIQIASAGPAFLKPALGAA